VRTQTDSGSNISLLLRTRIFNQILQTDADLKFQDLHISGTGFAGQILVLVFLLDFIGSKCCKVIQPSAS